jgi:hypothetical protein
MISKNRFLPLLILILGCLGGCNRSQGMLIPLTEPVSVPPQGSPPPTTSEPPSDSGSREDQGTSSTTVTEPKGTEDGSVAFLGQDSGEDPSGGQVGGGREEGDRGTGGGGSGGSGSGRGGSGGGSSGTGSGGSPGTGASSETSTTWAPSLGSVGPPQSNTPYGSQEQIPPVYSNTPNGSQEQENPLPFDRSITGLRFGS